MKDPYNLQRFLSAHETVYASAYSELVDGRKRGHWMWFIFPQVVGLGMSETSRYYGVSGLAEATAYLENPVLGSRLVECSHLVVIAKRRTAAEIFGSVDSLKFRSSMTLFASVPGADPVFDRAISDYFEGQPDEKTLFILACHLKETN